VKTQLSTDKPVHLDVTLKPGAWIDPEKIFRQISDAGYSARKDEVRLTLTGKILKEGDKLFLLLDDIKSGPLKFLLLKGSSKKEQEAKALTEAFQAAGEQGDMTVELEGLWRPADKRDKSALPMLTVLKVGPARPKEGGK